MRAALVGLALLPLVATAGCGDPAPGADPAPPTPTSSGPAAPAWNPCADLSAAGVTRVLGAEVIQETGTEDLPRCAFLPVEKGGPTLNVTYVWFDGGFEDAWDSMGEIEGRVSDLDLPGADHARLVVNATAQVAFVTGFVKTGQLVETVNAVALAPYDRGRLVRATRTVLATLARHAPASPAAAG